MTKRKLDKVAARHQHAVKRVKLPAAERCDEDAQNQPASVAYGVLPRCYSQVKTLKGYLNESLPSTSRSRRKRLAQFESQSADNSHLLNTTLVGINTITSSSTQVARANDLNNYTSTQRASKAATATAAAQTCTLDEVKLPTLCLLILSNLDRWLIMWFGHCLIPLLACEKSPVISCVTA